jgi:hypothetical protein
VKIHLASVDHVEIAKDIICLRKSERTRVVPVGQVAVASAASGRRSAVAVPASIPLLKKKFNFENDCRRYAAIAENVPHFCCVDIEGMLESCVRETLNGVSIKCLEEKASVDDIAACQSTEDFGLVLVTSAANSYIMRVSGALLRQLSAPGETFFDCSIAYSRLTAIKAESEVSSSVNSSALVVSFRLLDFSRSVAAEAGAGK